MKSQVLSVIVMLSNYVLWDRQCPTLQRKNLPLWQLLSDGSKTKPISFNTKHLFTSQGYTICIHKLQQLDDFQPANQF